MAKAKSPKDTVVEYFQGIKYYIEEDKMIVVLPDGLLLKKAELSDKEVKLEMYIDGLSSVVFVSEIDAPEGDYTELLVLQAEDAKFFLVSE